MSQIVSLALKYTSLLHEHYQRLSHLPGFVVLASTDKSRGRYDIISACPYDSIKIDQHAKNVPSLLKKLKRHLLNQPSVNDLPFQGGAIGYISYDLGAKLLGINSPVQPCLSEMPLVDLGFYDWAFIVDHQLRRVTLFAANTHSSTAEIIEKVLILWNMTICSEKTALVNNEFTPLMSQAKYNQAFSAIHDALKQGRSYQVNLTQSFHAAYEGDSWELYKKISTKNPVPYAAFFRTEDADILSFSPEQFLFYEDGKLVTSPIKGTIGRSSDFNEDEQLKHKLASCTKNRAENVMIVDLLRNDLGKISQPGSVKVTRLCDIESYNSVHHLVSTIESRCLNSIHPFDAFLSCFPGGSITGAPKIESMKIISEQELYARGIYCGSIGYFSRHGRFETNIAIRTITAKNNLLHLAAGGGIVIDSACEDEYRECFIKIAAIINGLK